MPSRTPTLLWLVLGLALLCLAIWLGTGSDDPPGPGREPHSKAEAAAVGPGATLQGVQDEPPLEAPSGREIERHAGPEGKLKPWPVGEPGEGEPGSGEVYILLVDGHGAPLVDHPIEVSWWLRFGVNGQDAGRTDDVGRFRTSANESWQIESVSVPTPAEPKNVQLYHSGPFPAHPEHPLEVRFEVPLSGLIKGRIQDLGGKPIAGRVSCSTRQHLGIDPFTFRMMIEEREARANQEGYYEIPVVVGAYALSANDATSDAHVTITTAQRVAEVNFIHPHPPLPHELEVIVLGVPDEAQPKIKVSARTEEAVHGLPPNTPGVRHESKTIRVRSTRLASNRFRLDGLVGDGWRVAASAPGRQGRIVKVPSGETALEIELEPAKAQVKRVVRIVGRLPSGKTVRPRIDTRFSIDGGRHSDHGDYFGPKDPHAEGTPVELYRDKATWLLLSYPGMGYTGVGPIPADSALTRIEVPLETQGEATVSLVDEQGEPLACTTSLYPTWRVFHEPLPSGGTKPGTRSGHAPFRIDVHRVSSDDGTMTFGWLPSAPFAVHAVPKDPRHAIARGEVRAGEHIRLVEGQGAGKRVPLRVLILDAQSGAPIAGASVRIYGENLPSVEKQPEGTTDAHGRLDLQGLVPGPTHVYIRAHGYAHPATQIVDPASLETPLEYRLHRKRLLPLRLVDPQGRPLETAEVRARRRDGTLVTLQDEYGGWDGEEVWTDGAGRADLAGLPAIPLSIEVMREGSKEVHTFELDLRTPPTKLLTLTVPESDQR